ncbi:MAG: hypothetical protein IT544_05610 [Rhodobacteraceae bacterium]|nr:hypothetical protein [Paracoccaceae bacterium]
MAWYGDFEGYVFYKKPLLIEVGIFLKSPLLAAVLGRAGKSHGVAM